MVDRVRRRQGPLAAIWEEGDATMGEDTSEDTVAARSSDEEEEEERRSAEAAARQAAEAEEDRAYEERCRVERQASRELALAKYNTLVKEMLPEVMNKHFHHLPMDARHTLTILMRRASHYFDAVVNNKLISTRHQLVWTPKFFGEYNDDDD